METTACLHFLHNNCGLWWGGRWVRSNLPFYVSMIHVSTNINFIETRPLGFKRRKEGQKVCNFPKCLINLFEI